MKLLLVCLSLVFIGCKESRSVVEATNRDPALPSPSNDVPVDFGFCEDGLQGTDDERDDVLIIGDSISMGYLPYVQSGLPDMDVFRCPCNGRSSRNGVLNIDLWLAKRANWKVIVFNHGLWDSFIGIGISLQDYERNLRIIATKLKQTGATVIYNTTTYIPIGETGRHFGYENELNMVASRVMQDFEIPVNDLYAVGRTIPHLMKNYPIENDVHFIDEGSRILGESVVEAIKGQILN